MNEYLVRPWLTALILVVSIFVAACGNEQGKGPVTDTGNTPASASPRATNNPTGPAGYVGPVDCDAIRGWALNQDHPDQPIDLELSVDGKLESTFKGDQFRKDLLDAGIGTGKYGFVYSIPAKLKDSRPHAIKVKAQGSDYELEFYKNTPRAITCTP